MFFVFKSKPKFFAFAPKASFEEGARMSGRSFLK